MQSNATSIFQQFVNLVARMIVTIWNFAYSQFVLLFSHAWVNVPLWKWIVIVIVLAVVIWFLWRYILLFVERLVELLVAMLRAVPALLVLGIVMLAVNFLVDRVH